MQETKILGLSGRKQSGKNTSANYILGVCLKSLGITTDFTITDKGELFVQNIFGDEEHAGVFDIFNQDPSMLDFRREYLDEIIRFYSFADKLKQVCMDLFGLTYNQCYGTDTDKNTPTKLRWENMPGVVTELPEKSWLELESIEEINGRLGKYYDKLNGVVYHNAGPMSAREVMQFFGTEIGRRMYSNIWVDATINQIKKDKPLLAIVPDTRFPNEVNGILSVGLDSDYPAIGNVIRFLRDPNNGADTHSSETSLDDFDQSKYLATVDNSAMSIDEQNAEVNSILTEIRWLPKEVNLDAIQ